METSNPNNQRYSIYAWEGDDILDILDVDPMERTNSVFLALELSDKMSEKGFNTCILDNGSYLLLGKNIGGNAIVYRDELAKLIN